jgi:hypothetical protein
MNRSGHRPRRLASACAVLALLFAAVTACGADAPGGTRVTGGEIDTGRTVQEGQPVRITARDTIDFGGGFLGIGAARLSADGDDGPAGRDAPAPHLRRHSLVVRIGEASYQGGVDKTFVAATTGEVVLLVNDAAPPRDGGGWDVQVEVGDQAGRVPQDDAAERSAVAFTDLPVGGRPIRTDVYVDAGATVRLTSAGVVDFGRAPADDASPRANAEGDDGPAPPSYPAPNLRPASLIAQIDGDPVWYQGGSDASFVVATSGALVFAANDDDVADNTASWLVSGRITPPVEPASAVAYGPFVVSNTTIETGLTAAPGQRVHVEARGLMNLGGGDDTGNVDVIDDATGDGADTPTPPDYPAPDLRKNSLVVQIGAASLQGGPSVDLTSRQGGPVVLLANDVQPEDNRSVLNGGVRGWSVIVSLR